MQTCWWPLSDHWSVQAHLTSLVWVCVIWLPWKLNRAICSMDPKKTIGHLFYATLSFLHHFLAIGEFKLEFPKSQIWVKIDDFFSRVTLKFDGIPSKTIGHLFSATSSFVQHFVAIGEFKLELQSGNAQSRSNSTIFRGVWPWNMKYDLANNRAPLLCYFKLCAAFHGHWWIQTGVTVWKRPM